VAAIQIPIERWAAWVPGISSHEQWQAWARGDLSPSADSQPELGQIPARLRRRLSPAGKMALSVAWRVLADTPPGQPLPAVFASRHGEADRTVAMLQALSREEALSPAQFSLSVHNAVSGVFSIAREDPSAVTALALRTEGPSLALLEAAMILAESVAERVLCVIYDKPMPEPYASAEPDLGPSLPYAAAFLLHRGGGDEAVTPTLALEAAHGGGSGCGELPILTLIRYLLQPGPEALLLPGHDHAWRWSPSPTF